MAAKTYLDFLAAFEAGVNGGIEPLLLPKNQLARAENATVRGAYISPRPPKVKREFIFASPLDQTTVEDGLFQGAGYYRPDFGTEQLIAQISGHLFSFTETGGKFVVADISIAGDLNSASATKVWMWQSEKWMIVEDGTGTLPIFYDGSSSRRSDGDSVLLGTTTGGFTVPAIGATVTLYLIANYTGPFNKAVIIHGEFYEPIQSLPGGYNAVLTNVNGNQGGTLGVGSQLIINPTNIGKLTFDVSFSINFPGLVTLPPGNLISVSLSSDFTGAIGDSVAMDYGAQNIPGFVVGQDLFLVHSITSPNQLVLSNVNSIHLWQPSSNKTYAAGMTVRYSTSQGPNVIVGTMTAAATIPAAGATVNIILGSAYVGAANQAVWIGADQYLVSPIPPPGPSSTLVVINLTDTGANPTTAQDILSVPELPAGRMGAYGQGRNWVCKTDGISFRAGDIVGGAAGTAANNYRDSVLKTTETTFMSGGGDFNLPTSGDIITAMLFPAVMDNSLGQGALQIGTANSMFSVNLPTDRTLWTSLTTPILPPSLVGKGPLGQDSTISANSDVLFREFDGLGALVQARRDFSDSASGIGGGNTPISREMDYIFRNDDQTILQYGSSKTFDNRYLTTYNPVQTPSGVVHSGLVVANMDLVSNLRTKLPPVYEGAWTGFNILKLVAGQVNGYRRAFAFIQNPTTTKTELYEFLTSADPQILDNGTDRISWNFDTPIIFNKDVKPLNELVKLTDGEIYTKDISGTVDIEVQYRPDFNSTWTTWHKFSITPKTWKPRMGLGLPSATDCETNGNRPMRVGYFFQCRAIITGNIKFMGMRFSASVEPETTFANPICNTI